MRCKYCGRNPDLPRLKFYSVDCCVDCMPTDERLQKVKRLAQEILKEIQVGRGESDATD